MKYTFGKAKDHHQAYKSGVEVPHRYQDIYLNGKKVGHIEIHLHKNKQGVSCGITTVVFRETT